MPSKFSLSSSKTSTYITFLNRRELHHTSFDFILDSIRYSLANAESVKCLTEADNQTQTTFTKCWCKILNELIYARPEKNSPFITLFQSSINSFHNAHTASCKTAVCFSLLLWRQLNVISFDGTISKKKLSKLLPGLLEQIVCVLMEKQLIHLTEYFSESLMNQRLGILSRHTRLSSKNKSRTYDFIKHGDFFKQLLDGICRHQKIFSQLIWKLLLTFGNYFNMEEVAIMVCHSRMNDFAYAIQEFKYDIFPGLVLNINASNVDLVNKLTNQIQINGLAIDASLLNTFTHLGFNKKLEFTEYQDDFQNETSIENWTYMVQEILTKSNIEILLVRGQVDKEIIDFCDKQSILVLRNLTPTLFKQLIEACKCNPLIYMEDFNEEINVFKCNLKHIASKELGNFYISLQDSDFDCQKKTIIIETRLESNHEMYKEYLLHCLKKVHNILENGYYLNGNGECENYLAENIIKKITWKSSKASIDVYDEDEVYFNLAKEAFSATFREFNSLIKINDVSSTNELFQTNRSYDDASSKIKAWEAACEINDYFLNSDMSIIY